LPAPPPFPTRRSSDLFVLSILTVLFVMFWTWEVVMAVYTYSVISDAAREGVRYAIVHGLKNQYCSGPVPTGFACPPGGTPDPSRSEEHTSELHSQSNL